MLEGEVAVRLVEYLFTLPRAGSMASVALDPAGMRAVDSGVFDINRFMVQAGWSQIKAPKIGRSGWTGVYGRDQKMIRMHSRPGEGGVATHVDGRRVIAKCTRGPLVRKVGNPEGSLLTMVLGQALLADVAGDDVIIAAVPDTPAFRRIVEHSRERPLIRKAGIQIVFVARNGAVSGANLGSQL
jgi:hypothetical protein